MSEKDFAGIGLNLLPLLSTGIIGLILLVIGVVCLALILGALAVVYITLTAYHLMTAVIFLVCALLVFVVGIKTQVISKDTMTKYPWLPLTIPCAFLVGYASELLQASGLNQAAGLTIAPLAVASSQQSTVTGLAIVVLVSTMFYLLCDLVGTKGKK